MRRERNARVDPCADRKGAAGIGSIEQPRIDEVIARRRYPAIHQVIAMRRGQAATRAGYISLLIRVAYLALAVWLVMTLGFSLARNTGQDMFPALKDGDLCVIFRSGAQKLLGQKLARNDVVAYQFNGKRHFGRAVALAGDVVMISESGSVTVNGSSGNSEILFVTDVRGDLEYPYRVPEGCLFVLGDYRTNTTDSRDLGPIPLKSVEGKVISILRRRGL